jgi:hypothetical protein
MPGGQTGSELSCYACYEGYALPECARRCAWSPVGDHAADAEAVALIVAEAVFAAPIDCRLELMGNIVCCGGDDTGEKERREENGRRKRPDVSH